MLAEHYKATHGAGKPSTTYRHLLHCAEGNPYNHHSADRIEGE